MDNKQWKSSYWRPVYLPTNDELLNAYVKRQKYWKGINENISTAKFKKILKYPPKSHPNMYSEDEMDEFYGRIEPPPPDIRDYMDLQTQIRIGYKKIY
jgi:hypothetical protein